MAITHATDRQALVQAVQEVQWCPSALQQPRAESQLCGVSVVWSLSCEESQLRHPKGIPRTMADLSRQISWSDGRPARMPRSEGTQDYQDGPRITPKTGHTGLITRRSRVQIPPPPPTHQVRGPLRKPGGFCIPDVNMLSTDSVDNSLTRRPITPTWKREWQVRAHECTSPSPLRAVTFGSAPQRAEDRDRNSCRVRASERGICAGAPRAFRQPQIAISLTSIGRASCEPRLRHDPSLLYEGSIKNLGGFEDCGMIEA
jgi:hypothetical protein